MLLVDAYTDPVGSLALGAVCVLAVVAGLTASRKQRSRVHHLSGHVSGLWQGHRRCSDHCAGAGRHRDRCLRDMVREFRRPRRVLSSRVATSAGGTLVGSVDEVREQILDPPDVVDIVAPDGRISSCALSCSAHSSATRTGCPRSPWLPTTRTEMLSSPAPSQEATSARRRSGSARKGRAPGASAAGTAARSAAALIEVTSGIRQRKGVDRKTADHPSGGFPWPKLRRIDSGIAHAVSMIAPGIDTPQSH